ncbi:MAG: DNA methylase, partial [Floccifex sp.]
MKTYLAVDLKSFYASVECIERGLDPLTTNLVVADESRTQTTICLAVSPSLKQLGLPGRCRLFEVEQKCLEIQKKTNKKINYIIATPRMSLYIEYSTKIYEVYTKYISKQDIHVYSIDEVFIDVSSYLSFYKMNAHDFC